MPKKKKYIDIEETLQDNLNFLNANDADTTETFIRKTLPRSTILFVGVVIFIIGSILVFRTGWLQIKRGEEYTSISTANTFFQKILFPERGIIYDRNGVPIAYNTENEKTQFLKREYTDLSGSSHIVGYVSYPQLDKNGYYFRNRIDGVEGAEYLFDEVLRGTHGENVIETKATDEILIEHTITSPRDGKDIPLSIDAHLNDALYTLLEETALEQGFSGGAAAIMDLKTGELFALTSYPEYDSEILSDGANREAIEEFRNKERGYFLNRAVSGLYIPGSVIKPFIAAGVLEEEIIHPATIIYTTGSISLINPYVEGEEITFYDWKNHGPVNFRRALALSSNVYFYHVVGGYKNQKGIGIKGVEEYVSRFGITTRTHTEIAPEPNGIIPTPEWKLRTFNDIWRIGDTYNSAIGQYGFQVTPLQIVRGISGIANEGILIDPVIEKNMVGEKYETHIDVKTLRTIKEGMRDAVLTGTASGLNVPYVEIAAKTGTAEVGTGDQKRVNSWVTGFFPYDNPQYTFITILENGPIENTIGGVFVMRNLLDHLNETEHALLQKKE